MYRNVQIVAQLALKKTQQRVCKGKESSEEDYVLPLTPFYLEFSVHSFSVPSPEFAQVYRRLKEFT